MYKTGFVQRPNLVRESLKTNVCTLLKTSAKYDKTEKSYPPWCVLCKVTVYSGYGRNGILFQLAYCNCIEQSIEYV